MIQSAAMYQKRPIVDSRYSGAAAPIERLLLHRVGLNTVRVLVSDCPRAFMTVAECRGQWGGDKGWHVNTRLVEQRRKLPKYWRNPRECGVNCYTVPGGYPVSPKSHPMGTEYLNCTGEMGCVLTNGKCSFQIKCKIFASDPEWMELEFCGSHGPAMADPRMLLKLPPHPFIKAQIHTLRLTMRAKPKNILATLQKRCEAEGFEADNTQMVPTHQQVKSLCKYIICQILSCLLLVKFCFVFSFFVFVFFFF